MEAEAEAKAAAAEAAEAAEAALKLTASKTLLVTSGNVTREPGRWRMQDGFHRLLGFLSVALCYSWRFISNASPTTHLLVCSSNMFVTNRS